MTRGDAERQSLWASVAGALGLGLGAGLCDVALTALTLGSLDPGGALVDLALHLAVGLAVAPLALLLAQLLLALPWRRWWRRALLFSLLPAVLLGALFYFYAWRRGIIFSALDYRPLLVLGVAASVGLGIFALARRAPGLWVVLTAVPALCLPAFLAVDLERAGPTLEVFSQKGVTSGLLTRKLRRSFDDDRDGYPRLICGQLCDCDDSTNAVSPVAVEIPGNGVDEDCSGADLELPPEPAAPPPVAEPLPVVEAEPDGPSLLERPNVLLITIDTLRADHLGSYGYRRDTSPQMDKLAAAGTRFDQARAQGPMTRFSVPVLMTGRYFTELDRTGGSWPRVMDSNTLISEVLHQAGYHTAAFHSIGYLVPLFGMSQGFDTYDVSVVRERAPVHWKPTSDLLTDRVLEHFDQEIAHLPADKPWFVWAYYGDPHSGYISHEGVPSFGSTIYDLYDQEIYFTDLHIGRLLEGLRWRGELGTAVVIITSDHGEGLDPEDLDNHGLQYHGQTLYDNLLRVPLIFQGPGIEASAPTEVVGNIDVFPTLLELVGVKPQPAWGLRGVSLVPWLRGQPAQRPPLFFEKATTEVIPQKAMIRWPWKIIWKLGVNRYELYHLEEDPLEQRDLYQERPEVAAPLRAELERWRSTELREIPPRDP